MIKKRLLFLTVFLLSFSLCRGEENKIIVCDNGIEMLEWDFEFIAQAEHSIEVAACFAGGKILRQLLSALEARLAVCETLQVYILTTPTLFEKEDRKMIAHLEKIFPERFHLSHACNVIVAWPDISGIDNHVKMMVIDEHYFSAGGTNLDEVLCSVGTEPMELKNNKTGLVGEIMPAGARDGDIVGSGPLAKQLRRAFHKMYSLWEYYNEKKVHIRNPDYFTHISRYFEIPRDQKPYANRFETSSRLISLKENQIKLLLCGPHQDENVITTEYARLINSAEKELLVGNLYFSPVRPIYRGLMHAVNRGVELTLLTNGVGEIPPDYTQYFCWGNRIHYVPMFYGREYSFHQKGLAARSHVRKSRVFEYNVKNIIYHKKMMIVDRKTVVIGSYNLGLRSDISDYELVLVIESPEVAEVARQVFLKDLDHSIEIFPEEAREWYFSPFVQYLGGVQKRINGLF